MALGRGYMSSSEPIVHFGLGADTLIKRLTVTWPNGTVQTLENIATNRHLVITEPTESTARVEIASAKPRETSVQGGQQTNRFFVRIA